MSSHGYATPLILEPRLSRWLLGLWLIVTAAALAALTLLPPLAGLAGIALLALALPRDLRRLRPPGRLEWHADGHWRIATPVGRQHARLAPGTVCTPWLVVLALRRPQGWRDYRVLIADALDPVSWRRLRVRLRIEGAEAMRIG